jgi:hypothetical protein
MINFIAYYPTGEGTMPGVYTEIPGFREDIGALDEGTLSNNQLQGYGKDHQFSVKWKTNGCAN